MSFELTTVAIQHFPLRRLIGAYKNGFQSICQV